MPKTFTLKLSPGPPRFTEPAAARYYRFDPAERVVQVLLTDVALDQLDLDAIQVRGVARREIVEKRTACRSPQVG